MSFKKLKEKIKKKKVKVGIIGLGYVGLPLAVEFAKNGVEVTGIDVSEDKIKKLKSGKSYIQDVSSKDVKNLVEKKLLKPTGSFKTIKNLDAVIICVPTPLRKSRDPDLSFIVDASERVAKNLSSHTLVILESTSYPGTTREILVPNLEKKGFKTGRDVFVVFSPERVDPGNKVYKIKNTPKVVGGINKDSVRLAADLYSHIVEAVVIVNSCEEAEMVKLLENTFRAVNIGLVNELTLLCDKFNLDIWNIIRAAATKPFGYMPFYPGPGLGGHCLPIDPQFLSWKAKTSQFYPHFIDYAEEINRTMPGFVVGKINYVLNELKKSVNGSKILIMGVSYKKNVGDTRESPCIEIVKQLNNLNAKLYYSDPYVRRFMDVKRIPISKIDFSKYDCTVIVTDHDRFDYQKIVDKSNAVVDCRGVTLDLKGKSKIVRI
ncbi:MAG: nucleotide sugar dehydrogenase [Elusimicrobiota bacterium]